MQFLLAIYILVLFLSGFDAFKPSNGRFGLTSVTRSTRSLLAMAKDSSEYWQGDWVCADCGYVYDIDYDGGGLYFEQQKKGFICPQCSAPRRRYAKKVGDQWGVTLDGGDFPIYITTFAGLAFTIWFALVYVPTL